MKVYVSKMGEGTGGGPTSISKGISCKEYKELKKKIADLIYEAYWIIDCQGRNNVSDFYMENEDEVIEEIIKLVKEDE